MSKKKIKAKEYNNYGKTIMFDLGESKGKFDKLYMTPLQALSTLEHRYNELGIKFKESGWHLQGSPEYIIVETALKKGEKLESMYGHLEKTLVKVNTEKEKYKKALEIIKKYPFVVQFIQTNQSYSDLAITMPNTEIPTEEECEFLKEILK